MKRVRPRYVLVKLGMLPFHILVGWNMTMPAFMKHLRDRRGVKDADPDGVRDSRTTRGRTFHFSDGKQTAIWLQYAPHKMGWTTAVLAHEAVHAMQFVCEAAGIPREEAAEEVLCYGVEHIMRTVLEAKP